MSWKRTTRGRSPAQCYRWLPLILAVLLLVPVWSWGQAADQAVEQLEGVGIEEHSGEPIPLNLAFVDSDGQPVMLQDYFDGKRPVVLTLNYYKCPMLCGLMLNGLVDSLSMLNWLPGKEFEVVTVSINPLEKPPLAQQNKQNYIKKLDKPEAARGWHFLTGKQAEITQLADAVGFKYVLDPETQQFLHQAAIFIITPDGRISRYMYGVQYPVNELKMSLADAADGRIGTTTERIFMACFSYDPESGSYVPQAMGMMRIAGVLTLIVLAFLLGGYWIKDARRRTLDDDNADADQAGDDTASEGTT